MNYLAHALLAAPDTELVLGGLMGDFVKGRLGDEWPAALRAGLHLHRRIDSFTDRHPAVAASRARFTTPRRRFAGIIVDVCYDHFLARDFESWSGGQSLRAFTAEVYTLLGDNRERLPGRLHRIAPRMAADDWLGGYADLAGIAAALHGMSLRSPRVAPLATAMDDVRHAYHDLHDDFVGFFPQLRAFVAVERGVGPECGLTGGGAIGVSTSC